MREAGLHFDCRTCFKRVLGKRGPSRCPIQQTSVPVIVCPSWFRLLASMPTGTKHSALSPKMTFFALLGHKSH